MAATGCKESSSHKWFLWATLLFWQQFTGIALLLTVNLQALMLPYQLSFYNTLNPPCALNKDPSISARSRFYLESPLPLLTLRSNSTAFLMMFCQTAHLQALFPVLAFLSLLPHVQSLSPFQAQPCKSSIKDGINFQGPITSPFLWLTDILNGRVWWILSRKFLAEPARSPTEMPRV